MKKEYAEERLREWLEPGDSISTKVTRYSSNSSDIQVLIGRWREIIDITIFIRDFIYPTKKKLYNGGIRIQGSGTNREFEIVYHLSLALFGDGYKLKKDSLN